MGGSNSKVAAAEAARDAAQARASDARVQYELAKSRVEAEQARIKEAATNHKNTIAMMNERFAVLDRMHEAQMDQVRADENRRKAEMKADLEKMRVDYNKNSAAREEKNSEEQEQMRKEHIRMLEEKERAMAKEREDQKEEQRKLIEKYEENQKNIEAKLDAEREKRIEEVKAHSEKVEALHREMHKLAEAKDQEIRALKGCTEMLLRIIKESQIQFHQNADGMINMFAIANVNEKGSTRLNDEKDARMYDIKIMKDCAGEIAASIVRAKMEFKKTGIVPEMDKTVELTLKMANDASSLGDKFESAIKDIEKSPFSRDFIEEVKKYLNVAVKGTNDLYEELLRVSNEMVETPLSVSLNAIRKCLENLKETIDSIPSPPTPTMDDSIDMARVAVQNQKEMANMRFNAIMAGVETMNLAIASGVETGDSGISVDVDPIVEEPP